METLEKISAIFDEHRTTLGGSFGLMEIVSAPKGRKQTSDVPGIDVEWVDQRGDESAGIPYHGDVYIELDPGKWGRFEFHT